MGGQSKNPPASFAHDSFNIMTTSTLSAINPGLGIAYGLAVSFFANALQLRSTKVTEWVEMIDKNRVRLGDSILNSIEFQDAFVNALEDYIRLRTLLKRSIAQKIFLGYATSEEISLFQLERHNETLKRISTISINFIKFLVEDIEPIRAERVRRDVDTYDLEATQIDEITIRQSVERQQIMSYAYDDWMKGKEKYAQVMVPSRKNPKYPNMSGSGAVYVKNPDHSIHDEALTELEALGIIWRKQYSQTEMTFGSSPQWFDRWNVTDFGAEFMNYIAKADKK